MAELVDGYNRGRLQSALGYLTPWDYLQGEEHVVRRFQARREALRRAGRQRRRHWRPDSTGV
jgi:hypothetical protein